MYLAWFCGSVVFGVWRCVLLVQHILNKLLVARAEGLSWGSIVSSVLTTGWVPFLAFVVCFFPAITLRDGWGANIYQVLQLWVLWIIAAIYLPSIIFDVWLAVVVWLLV